MYKERNGTDFHSFFGTERFGTERITFRDGTEWSQSERIIFRKGTERVFRNGTERISEIGWAGLAVPGGLSMPALARPMRESEQNEMDIFGTERNGTHFSEQFFFRNETERIFRNEFFFGTERNGFFRNGFVFGTEQNGTVHPCSRPTSVT